MAERIAVIGAGMAGLTAARRISSAGHAVEIFEKSRGFGGRLATRRRELFSIDHGAPAIQSGAPEFTRLLEAAGCLQDGAGDWIGQPGMSAIGRALAGDLSVVRESEVSAVTEVSGGLTLQFSDGTERAGFDRVVVAVPAPQARRFLSGLASVDAALAGVEMRPVWTLVLAFEHQTGLECPGPDGPFDLVVPNARKPGRPALPETWAAHAAHAWTEAHLEAEREDIAERLWAAFRDIAGRAMPVPAYAAAHRWRFARTSRPLGAPCLEALDGRVLIGGDWALGDRAEHAWRSGLAMAEAVLA